MPNSVLSRSRFFARCQYFHWHGSNTLYDEHHQCCSYPWWHQWRALDEMFSLIWLLDFPPKITQSRCPPFTVVPNTGVGLPKTGVSFYCDLLWHQPSSHDGIYSHIKRHFLCIANMSRNKNSLWMRHDVASSIYSISWTPFDWYLCGWGYQKDRSKTISAWPLNTKD